MEECSLVDEIKAGTFLIENIESEEFITESKDNIKNELFYDEEQMQECSPAGEIKTEICLNENTESEKLLAESKGSIKNELFYEEEQTQGKLELANDRDRIKTEGGVYDDKQNYKFKTGIEDIMDSFKVEPSEKVQDLVINEELDIKSDTDFVDMAMSENSLQSCSDDTQDSFQSREGMQNSAEKLENKEVDWQNTDELKEFKRKKHVKRRVKEQTEEFKCDLCNVVKKCKWTLKSHMEHVHSKILCKCDDCDYSTTHPTNLHSHRKIKHPVGNAPEFKCSLCEFTTRHKSYLKTHIDCVHVAKKLHKCNECDFSTPWRYLVKHKERKHRDESAGKSRKLFKCNLCSYTSSCEFRIIHKGSLKSHVHLEVKKYKCHLCDFVATTQSFLEVHIDREHFAENAKIYVRSATVRQYGKKFAETQKKKGSHQ